MDYHVPAVFSCIQPKGPCLIMSLITTTTKKKKKKKKREILIFIILSHMRQTTKYKRDIYTLLTFTPYIHIYEGRGGVWGGTKLEDRYQLFFIRQKSFTKRAKGPIVLKWTETL